MIRNPLRLAVSLAALLTIPACKAEIAADPATSASNSSAASEAKASPSAVQPPKSAKVINVDTTPPSAQPRPATTDANGLPTATDGVLADGVADGILKSGSPPVVKLIAAGNEPREELTYSLTEKKKQTVGMRMNLEMKMEMGGQAAPATAVPEIGMNLDLATGKKDAASGDIQVTGTIGKVAVLAKNDQEKQLAKTLEPIMGGMKGMTINYFVSPKGRARNVEVKMPPKADASAKQMLEQMKQSFDSMVAPLPDEPVGEGASWVVVTRINTGADVLQYTTYKLVSRKGSKVVLDTKVQQFAASGTLVLPGQGSGGHITKFLSGGDGSSTIDLGSLAPDKGTGNVAGSMGFEAGAVGRMNVDTKVKIEFGPAIP